MEVPLVSTTVAKAQGTYSERSGQDFRTFVGAYRKILCGQEAMHRALYGSLGYLTVGFLGIAAYTRYYMIPTRLPTKGLLCCMLYSGGFYVHLERGYILCAQGKAAEDVEGVWKKHEKDQDSLV